MDNAAITYLYSFFTSPVVSDSVLLKNLQRSSEIYSSHHISEAYRLRSDGTLERPTSFRARIFFFIQDFLLDTTNRELIALFERVTEIYSKHYNLVCSTPTDIEKAGTLESWKNVTLFVSDRLKERTQLLSEVAAQRLYRCVTIYLKNFTQEDINGSYSVQLRSALLNLVLNSPVAENLIREEDSRPFEFSDTSLRFDSPLKEIDISTPPNIDIERLLEVYDSVHSTSTWIIWFKEPPERAKFRSFIQKIKKNQLTISVQAPLDFSVKLHAYLKIATDAWLKKTAGAYTPTEQDKALLCEFEQAANLCGGRVLREAEKMTRALLGIPITLPGIIAHCKQEFIKESALILCAERNKTEGSPHLLSFIESAWGSHLGLSKELSKVDHPEVVPFTLCEFKIFLKGRGSDFLLFMTHALADSSINQGELAKLLTTDLATKYGIGNGEEWVSTRYYTDGHLNEKGVKRLLRIVFREPRLS